MVLHDFGSQVQLGPSAAYGVDFLGDLSEEELLIGMACALEGRTNIRAISPLAQLTAEFWDIFQSGLQFGGDQQL